MTAPQNTSGFASTVRTDDGGDLRCANRLASQAKARWRQGEQPDVAAMLAEHPELSRCRSVALDLACEEYSRRLKAGEALDPERFSQRFPTLWRSLWLQIRTRGLLDKNPGVRADEEIVPWPEVGDSFLGFQLAAELGRGSFGRVFLAYEPALGNRQVALKVAPYGGEEAKILGKLAHPHIVPVYSIQKDPASSLAAFCMPYPGRATLCEVLDRAFTDPRPPQYASAILDAVRAANGSPGSADGPLPDHILRCGTYVEGVVHLGIQLSEALAHSHRRGIYHRDLKPSNVLLSPNGQSLLLDFNVSVDGRLPAARIGGTLPYMAPEQLALMPERNTNPCAWDYDPRSDLFSLGVILYESLTGVLPFEDLPASGYVEDVAVALRERQAQGPRPLDEHPGQVDPGIARLILACLAFDPEDRPETAGELAAVLRRELAPLRRGRRWARRHRRPLAVAGSVLLAIVLAVSGFLATRPPYSLRQFQRGVRYSQQGEYQLAVECLNESLRSSPQDRDALFARGRALEQLGDFRMAMDDFTEANRLAPSPTLAACQGYCLSRLNQHETAIAAYRKAWDLGYRSAGLLNNIGYSFHALRRLDESEKYLKQALEADEDLPAAHHNLVNVFLRRALHGQPVPPEAFFHVRRAVELSPPSADLYRDVAKLCAVAARGDATRIESAIEYLEKGLLYGLDPQAMGKEPAFAALAGNPAFERLRTQKAASSPATRAAYLVDPL